MHELAAYVAATEYELASADLKCAVPVEFDISTNVFLLLDSPGIEWMFPRVSDDDLRILLKNFKPIILRMDEFVYLEGQDTKVGLVSSAVSKITKHVSRKTDLVFEKLGVVITNTTV